MFLVHYGFILHNSNSSLERKQIILDSDEFILLVFPGNILWSKCPWNNQWTRFQPIRIHCYDILKFYVIPVHFFYSRNSNISFYTFTFLDNTIFVRYQIGPCIKNIFRISDTALNIVSKMHVTIAGTWKIPWFSDFWPGHYAESTAV